MNSYEAKQAARRERLERKADRLEGVAQRRQSSAFAILDMIPPGQPILVGHHSERRHRRDLAKVDGHMRAGFEAQKAAGEARARAESVGYGGISSDDPDAVAKLKAELAGLEQRQERMKSANAAARKAKTEAPHAAYQLSNNSANMRRIRLRIEHLERRAKDKTTEQTINGVRIVDNVEANRLQMIFPDKPSAEVRTALKGAGFRWSPSEGAWQRHRGTNAKWMAQDIAGKLPA